MTVVREKYVGACLEAIGIPNRGTAIIDKGEKPRVLDVVWCDSPTGGLGGYLKQIVQTGEHAVVRTRYADQAKDYMFLSPVIFGVVLQVLDENGNTAWERPKKTNADRIRAMSDDDLAKWLCDLIDCYSEKCPARYICSAGDNGLVKWMQQPWEEE